MVIEGESVKIFATIPLPSKIHEREMDKTDIPGTFNAGATLGPVNETNMARIWNKHKQSNTPLKRKVFVGMSGGVDSSVAAALLKGKGYDIIGVFIRAYNLCDWQEERRWALRAAAHLGIPLETLDLSREYEREVVERMLREYERGRTPNPDIWCNRAIKFGALWDYARAQGAQYIATGHYAENCDGELLMSADAEKDQTYFLWTLTRDDLAHVLFPIGAMTKQEVREKARELGLPNAQKKDSQGVCFIGEMDVKDFLASCIVVEEGRVLDERGRVIGTHPGALLFTLGERHGFTVTEKSPHDEPFYVITKDMSANTITVSPTPLRSRGAVKEINLEEISWVNAPPEIGKTYYARLRHRAPLIPSNVRHSVSDILLTFSEPVLAAPGQSCVLYDGSVCLGGGIIT